ncbi:MAG: type II toxin-antitoxin system RelE/ParE family toxin [Verrucomicrobiota bacterium]
MDHELIWTLKASADLEAIVRCIARRNPTAAAEIGQGIIERVEFLVSHPLAGSALHEPRDGPYRKILFRRWKIIYSFRNSQILIMRIWPAALGAVDFGRPL